MSKLINEDKMIRSMRRDCIKEYPMPYFGGNDQEMLVVYEGLKKKYKDAKLFHFMDHYSFICLDKISISYYAALLKGANFAMGYCDFYYKSIFLEENTNCNNEMREIIKEYDIEGVFKLAKENL